MRDYSKVNGQFWTGKTGKALRGDAQAQIVALYLVTSPHSNMIGVYHCPILYIAHETGLPIEGASKGLQRLIEGEYCTYDEASDTVFVHEMAKYQIGESLSPNDKQVKGVQKQFDNLPQGRIKQEFFARYAKAFHLAKTGGKGKPLRSPLQDPPKPGAGAGAGTGTGNPHTPKGAEELFAEFWEAYPRKVGKDAVKKLFLRKAVDESLLAEMLAAIAEQAATEQWRKDGGQFIPNPATWLNQGRWQDEVPQAASAPAFKPGTDEYLEYHQRNSTWWSEAGFATVWDAANERCYHHNASQFRNGKRCEVAA